MDEIVAKGDCYNIYTTDEWGPAIPYPAVPRPNGDTNNGFFDLRSQPEASEKVPEALGKPGLIALIRTINGPDSNLMTLGCENGVFHLEPPEIRPNGPTCYIGSYIDIAFRDPALAASDNVINLAKLIIETRKPVNREWTTIDIGVQKMRHFFGVEGCHNLTLRISAHAPDEGEAWKSFNAQCQQVKKVFDKLFANGANSI